MRSANKSLKESAWSPLLRQKRVRLLRLFRAAIPLSALGVRSSQSHPRFFESRRCVFRLGLQSANGAARYCPQRSIAAEIKAQVKGDAETCYRSNRTPRDRGQRHAVASSIAPTSEGTCVTPLRGRAMGMNGIGIFIKAYRSGPEARKYTWLVFHWI